MFNILYVDCWKIGIDMEEVLSQSLSHYTWSLVISIWSIWVFSKRADENALSSSQQHHWRPYFSQHESVKADNIKAERTKLTCSVHLYRLKMCWRTFIIPTEIWYEVASIPLFHFITFSPVALLYVLFNSSMHLIQFLTLSHSPLYFLLLYAFKNCMWGFSLPGALFDSQWTFINTFKNKPDEEIFFFFFFLKRKILIGINKLLFHL